MFYLDNDEKQGQGHIKVISRSYCQKYVKKNQKVRQHTWVIVYSFGSHNKTSVHFMIKVWNFYHY